MKLFFCEWKVFHISMQRLVCFQRNHRYMAMRKKALWTLICFYGLYSCSKVTNDSHDSISLLQQKWDLVSKYGESFRYVGKPGDYYIFEGNGKLYEFYDGKTDTFNYSFDGLTGLQLHQYINGNLSSTPINYHLDVLTNTQLIMSASVSPTVTLRDSLSR